MSEPRKIVVSWCGVCPFAVEDSEDRIGHCTAPAWASDWVEKVRRFDTPATPYTPPSWCPLRQGPVTVELEVQS